MISQCSDLHIMDLRAEKDRHAGERAGFFLCDKPGGASRARTKMHPTANGQSSRCSLLDLLIVLLSAVRFK